jgi:hypothetical protein
VSTLAAGSLVILNEAANVAPASGGRYATRNSGTISIAAAARASINTDSVPGRFAQEIKAPSTPRIRALLFTTARSTSRNGRAAHQQVETEPCGEAEGNAMMNGQIVAAMSAGEVLFATALVGVLLCVVGQLRRSHQRKPAGPLRDGEVS